MSTTAILLDQIRRLGYIVKTFRMNGVVELHAVPLAAAGVSHVARCNDGDGPDDEYRAACLLAHAVGIELDDG